MGETVQLFVTCLIDSLFPEVGESTVEVLRRSGCQVEFPADQTCCGQPAYNAGHRDQARRMARHTLAVFSATQGRVVVPSGSCAHMLRHGYLELLDGDRRWLPQAKALAERTFELSEYLVDRLGAVALGASASRRVAYHPSCHLLRGLGVERQPLALLGALEGLSVHRLEPECCGFGGVFSVKHADISAAMLSRKLDAIQQAGCEAVVGCDVSCLMHIEGGLRRASSGVRCAHLAQVLAGKAPGLR